jgi:homeodomain-containing protein
MTLPCGCCNGAEPVTPIAIANRPGLSALAYRAGTYASFFETMMARLSNPDFPTLAALQTREPDDPAIALIDAWAIVADVLTFYQERIANEGYLRTDRKGFRLFWRWKSRPVGRPRLPKDIQALIRQMAAENPTWGQEHIANELKLKLGIRVSPRTVGKYLRECPRREPDPSQRWLTFVRNHAQAMVACDFFVVVTARFRILYVPGGRGSV